MLMYLSVCLLDVMYCTMIRDLLCDHVISTCLVTKALQDAGLPYSVIEHAAVGYVYGKNQPTKTTPNGKVVSCSPSKPCESIIVTSPKIT